jgi:signal transduction histidine kinase
VGVVLLIAGIASLADRTGGLAGVGASAGAIAVVVGGLAIFFAPALGRLLRRLDEERAARIREDERATMAAHLHDSVLQSLVLMQRTDDPRRITTIARRQERELRAWLYGTKHDGEPTSLHAAIDALAVKIEADHDIRVEAVVVGDQPLDDSSRALVAAIREAVVNAARHAGIDRVDVFVEADDAELTGFVRDTGRGFDPEAVGDDRRGISESIVGRIQRLGGTAVLTSAPGTGTEVELRVPRRRS